MSTEQQITNHEEVRDELRDGPRHAAEVAASLIISTSTARRYLEECVARGWVTRQKVRSHHGSRRNVGVVLYSAVMERLDEDW